MAGNINKRNSANSLTGYYEESDAEFESEYEIESDKKATAPGENPFIIEKILGRKFVKNEAGSYEELFFIKWKTMSYIHASWERREDIEVTDANGKLKIKRFLQSPQPIGVIQDLPKETENNEEEVEEESDDIDYFNPDMVEVHRVIACDSPYCQQSKAKTVEEIEECTDDVKYLVKWRGQPYNECTWEKWSDISTASYEVLNFWRCQKPRKKALKKTSFPSLQDYHRLKASPVYGIDERDVEDGKTSETGSSSESASDKGGLRLRDYQLEGVNWLLWNWWHKRPCILADEMGLGKTIQTVTFLHQLRHMPTTNIDGPFLIIAPLSLVDQWQSEIATWSPSMNCVLLHGNTEARETIFNNEFYFHEPYVPKSECPSLKRSNILKFNILLTTFEVATKDIRFISRINWKVLIIDEAHKLKNPSSRNFQSMATIPHDHCVLLTGTPLQNKTEELWALLNFADNARFSDLQEFIGNFGDLKDSSQVAKLHDVLKPYLLRRIKEDVEKSLPPKEETIVEVALTSLKKKKFYRAIYEKNTSFLFKGLKASNQPSLMNVMMELRKCCNHPYLVKGVEERVLAELPPVSESNAEQRIILQQNKLIESSGKLVLLDKLLPKLQSQGHKVLIFSQMVRVLHILEDFLRIKGYTFERLDGSTKAVDRKDAVERFCKPSLNRFIMLLSTKAGGLGLNLTAADTVIIYDSDWNPQNDLQAQARAHRIGQTKAVMVYRLLTRKTYEMEMFHHASLKLGLDRAVLAHARGEQEEENSSKKGKDSTFNVSEIDQLLKKGAYDVFREDDTEQNEFVEADIDSILLRRSHKVVYDSKGGVNASSLGSFSKASFVSADEKEDVDINDPDFWKKAIGLQENAGGLLAEPDEMELLPQQRVRKQTRVYGDDTQMDDYKLDEFLKPEKSEKEEKAAAQKAHKETLQREKQERDEARQLKLETEMKQRSDPQYWGPHARDRVLRALNLYGFGRWGRICSESGGSIRDPKGVEIFSRAYILQCGLCACDKECTKSDSPFVRDAVNAARQVELLVKSGQRKLDMPSSLTDEKFQGKLRAGGAKKALNKLDVLSKLIDFMRQVMEAATVEKGEAVDHSVDLDVLVSGFSLEEITRFMPLGDIRPDWIRGFCPWWDLECDKHLVYGIFKHGYGRIDLVKDDPELCFKGIIQQGREAGGSPEKEDGQSDQGSVDEGQPKSASSQPEEHDDAQVEKAVVNSEEEVQMTTESGQPLDTFDMTSIHASVLGGKQMPESRILNRLVMWLVSTDMARMTRQQLVEKQKRTRAKRLASLQKKKEMLEYSIDMDIAEKTRVQQAEAYLQDENSQIERLRSFVDVEAIGWALRREVQGLKKCESILKMPLYYEESDNVIKSEVEANVDPNLHVEVKPEQVETLGANEKVEGKIEPNVEITLREEEIMTEEAVPMKEEDSGEVAPVEDLVEEVEEDHSEDENDEDGVEEEKEVSPQYVFSDYEAARISSALILYGAPMDAFAEKNGEDDDDVDIATKPLFQDHCIGEEPLTVGFKKYSWADVLLYTEVNQTEEQLEYFYRQVWLSFCNDVSRSNELSYAQDKFVVPNPLLKPADHHYAVRGLCHIFLIRQQLMHAIDLILTHHRPALVHFLKNIHMVELMPVWWCPWIHDLGVLVSMAKHGFLHFKRMVEDPELPFNREYLERHIRQVFLFGNITQPPAAGEELKSVDTAEAFVQFALLQFPDYRVLELRMIKIMQEVTSILLPLNHPYRVESFAWLLPAGQIGVGGQDAVSVKGEGEPVNGSGGKQTRKRNAGTKGTGRATKRARKPSVKAEPVVDPEPVIESVVEESLPLVENEVPV